MQFFYIIFAVSVKYILPTFHCHCQPSYKISSKYLSPRLNYNNFFEIQDGVCPLSWIFKNLISEQPLGLLIFHLCTKFGAKMMIDAEIMALSKPKMAAVRHLGFVTSSYRTTHEVFSFGHIGLSNFMLIRCIVLKIWWFEFFADLAWNAYSRPQNFVFWGSESLNVIGHHRAVSYTHLTLPTIYSV